MPQENTPTAYASIIKEAPIPKFVYTPFLREFISAHHTTLLLDINCKEGHFCRLSKDLGVSTVVGIDVSEANIAYAKEQPGYAQKVGTPYLLFRLNQWRQRLFQGFINDLR